MTEGLKEVNCLPLYRIVLNLCTSLNLYEEAFYVSECIEFLGGYKVVSYIRIYSLHSDRYIIFLSSVLILKFTKFKRASFRKLSVATKQIQLSNSSVSNRPVQDDLKVFNYPVEKLF